MKKILLLVSLFMLSISLNVSATGLSRLNDFIQHTKEGRASFTQTSVNEKGQVIGKTSTGVFEFSRPGLFRWNYQLPYQQSIIGDGKNLWIWDPDLEQVTRKPLSGSLGSTPAALLAGDNTLEKGFNLMEAPEDNGLQWVSATPKTQEAGFQSIKMGFDDQSLVVMELVDSFKHTVIIHFGSLNKAPHFKEGYFHFSPPTGADVIE
ncbi:MAG: outer membrane lipoprotein carrier protein LolA [Ferrovum sp. 37-45-19]|nr:MAG: outer membrane lipoprotein carrier protein LolA [Ferrovum sp. 21-44-67]OYV94202.1 MAG: outer membrane lipoprotein carrier protein LolA [Ferrovum sp. 37-45-19]OZB31765.1 MAG: outer membrane lipoprotein carrier protein LolA [Ferrovum sp. 34-44-207]HQT81672.1 outer membrane lipoprotein chaperone LolA [Ferrovaceae bacterium]HQU06974.1 outer membrane lipoprotein chaperone LolA [Ferrovaceae bacterium]